MKLLRIICLILMTKQAAAQFNNIQLATKREGEKYGPCEPSVAINLKDPQNIVVGTVLDRAIYSEDGGKTWQETKVTSPYGVYGDPALLSDTKGNIYFFHLADPSGEGRKNEAWLDRLVVNRSKDGGKTWNEGDFVGLNPPKDQDKQWATLHLKNDDIYLTWTQFDKYGDENPACQSNILFSKSSSKGEKWTKPVVLSNTPGDCKDSDNTAEGAVTAVNYDGKLFAIWANQGVLFLDRSYDGGETWLRNDLAMFEQPGGWDMKIPGLGRSNGFPVLVCDNSKSIHNGMLYVIWADQRDGENNTNIWFSRSNNYGDSWTVPQKVNDDETETHQFMPWMAIDQTTGYIYIVYYDRSPYTDNQTDVKLSYSTDAGLTFKHVTISEKPFIPVETTFFGDYNNIAAHEGVIVPVWTRMDDGSTSVWTTVIQQDQLIESKDNGKKKKK
jgi:hypothetical protein